MMQAVAWPAAAGKSGRRELVDRSALEREVKFAVPSLEQVAARLHALEGAGAHFIHAVHEYNYVLDTARDELKARGERLRIRDIEGRPGVQVTWKGPARLRNGVRRREEREFHADSREACVAVLSSLGLRPVRSYEKVRSSWRLNDVIVCLDSLSCGTFVEIELTSEVNEESEAIALQRAVALLGLQDAPRVQASYARLQQEWRATLPRHLR
jgi:predicted adenylyl cyclase CyaB